MQVVLRLLYSRFIRVSCAVSDAVSIFIWYKNDIKQTSWSLFTFYGQYVQCDKFILLHVHIIWSNIMNGNVIIYFELHIKFIATLRYVPTRFLNVIKQYFYIMFRLWYASRCLEYVTINNTWPFEHFHYFHTERLNYINIHISVLRIAHVAHINKLQHCMTVLKLKTMNWPK